MCVCFSNAANLNGIFNTAASAVQFCSIQNIYIERKASDFEDVVVSQHLYSNFFLFLLSYSLKPTPFTQTLKRISTVKWTPANVSFFTLSFGHLQSIRSDQIKSKWIFIVDIYTTYHSSSDHHRDHLCIHNRFHSWLTVILLAFFSKSKHFISITLDFTDEKKTESWIQQKAWMNWSANLKIWRQL